MSPIQLRNLANTLGLTIYTWSPGDGCTRYRFFEGTSATNYCSGGQLFTALGAKEATLFLTGFRCAIDGRTEP